MLFLGVFYLAEDWISVRVSQRTIKEQRVLLGTKANVSVK